MSKKYSYNYYTSPAYYNNQKKMSGDTVAEKQAPAPQKDITLSLAEYEQLKKDYQYMTHQLTALRADIQQYVQEINKLKELMSKEKQIVTPTLAPPPKKNDYDYLGWDKYKT